MGKFTKTIRDFVVLVRVSFRSRTPGLSSIVQDTRTYTVYRTSRLVHDDRTVAWRWPRLPNPSTGPFPALGSVTCGMLRPPLMVARCGLAPREECPAAIQTHSDTSSAVYVPLLQSLRTHSLSSSTIGYCAPSRILSSRDHRRADAFCAESSLPREPSCAPPLSHVHYVLGGPRLCWTPVHADGAGPTLTCAQTAPRECRNASTTRSRARSARPCRWHPRGRRPARPPA